MAQFIVFRRDQDGTIERVDGRWEAELPEFQPHIMTSALDQEKRGRPKPT